MQKTAYKDLEKALMAQTLQEGGPFSNIEFADMDILKNGTLGKMKKGRKWKHIKTIKKSADI